ncbi:hypothetical protein PUV54_04260 [Hyphococcus flavus]|uniref:DUF4164 family protein n=1 Tax=Hyphococcus flavus TaxID=1866326 RepID=A0AAE9ZJS8_9PROT|nr:hypothetical protein [Hyphococcus flavus]WDI32406.1 hypothetical protein PUV54_04260 [Hyphococcus flavus]
MTLLEKSVRNLAEALETLESKLDDKLEDLSASQDAIDAAKRQAVAARKQTDHASRGVAAAISDIKAMLADDEDRKRGSDESG